MSKQLYEEAIADVKKIKEVAEDNAKRVIIEAVAPRIRELIEKELLGEAMMADELDEISPEETHGDEDDHGAPGSSNVKTAGKDLITDDPNAAKTSSSASKASSSSSSSGHEKETDEASVSMDELDKFMDEDDMLENYALSDDEPITLREFQKKLRYVTEMVKALSDVETHIAETKQYQKKVSDLNVVLESLHEYVQERISNPSNRLGYNFEIKKCFEKLENLQETKMKKRNGLLSESEVMLKLIMDDEADFDPSMVKDVELVTGEDEEESPEGEAGAEDLELDLGDEEAGEEEAGGEEAEEEEDEEEADLAEVLELSDNTVVEIDENMLRREIGRMKALREASEHADVQKWGHGAGKVSDEFEDEDLGDPLVDGEVTTEGWDLDEMGADKDDDLLELDGYDLDEEDDRELAELDQAKSESDPQTKYKNVQGRGDAPSALESIERRLAREARIQTEAKKRAAKAAKAKKDAEKKGKKQEAKTCESAYRRAATIFNESVARANKLKSMLNEANARRGKTSNGPSKSSAAETNNLRNKLAETNLLNAKLLFTNKLLQSDALTSRQKSQVIEQLDSATTLREVKLVYESLAKTLTRPQTLVNESRVLGSSSRATRPASTQMLNEVYEAERWAKLAGIGK